MPPSRLRAPSMGVFKVRIRVFSLRDASKGQDIELTVDTGASYPVIPRTLAENLDAEPMGRRTFVLANGAHIDRDVSSLGMEYEGRRGATLVVLGETGDAPLLGALALEALGYETDPVSKTLRPVMQYLMHFRRIAVSAPPSS